MGVIETKVATKDLFMGYVDCRNRGFFITKKELEILLYNVD